MMGIIKTPTESVLILMRIELNHKNETAIWDYHELAAKDSVSHTYIHA